MQQNISFIILLLKFVGHFLKRKLFLIVRKHFFHAKKNFQLSFRGLPYMDWRLQKVCKLHICCAKKHSLQSLSKSVEFILFSSYVNCPWVTPLGDFRPLVFCTNHIFFLIYGFYTVSLRAWRNNATRYFTSVLFLKKTSTHLKPLILR